MKESCKDVDGFQVGNDVGVGVDETPYGLGANTAAFLQLRRGQTNVETLGIGVHQVLDIRGQREPSDGRFTPWYTVRHR